MQEYSVSVGARHTGDVNRVVRSNKQKKQKNTHHMQIREGTMILRHRTTPLGFLLSAMTLHITFICFTSWIPLSVTDADPKLLLSCERSLPLEICVDVAVILFGSSRATACGRYYAGNATNGRRFRNEG